MIEEVEILPKEKYKFKSIFSEEELPYYKEEFNDFSLFERPKIAQKAIEENNTIYTIEDLLYLDDTNKIVQFKYIELIIEKYNQKNDLITKEFLREKLMRANVILNKTEYNVLISRINDKDLIDLDSEKKLEYIDYKYSLSLTLSNILNNGIIINFEEIKKNLGLKFNFEFNQPCEIGENNHFFFNLCLEFLENCQKYNEHYIYLLQEFYTFLTKENFDELNQDKRFRFDHISYCLFDKKAIKTISMLKKASDFLKGKKVQQSELVKAISQIKNKKFFNQKYDLEYDYENKDLIFILEQDKRINGKKYKYYLKNSYKINFFSEQIINVIKTNFSENFECELFKHTLPLYLPQQEFFKNIRPILERYLSKILSSEAAEAFFQKYYVKKYTNLKYHFKRIEVQKEIFKRMNFSPLFNQDDDGFTNSNYLKITLNSIPHIIAENNIPSFNRNLLHLGRLLLVSLHEILGHFIRKYYSYLTGRKVCMRTIDEDNDIYGCLYTTEGGFLVENEFIGLKNTNILRLNDCFQLLYLPNYSKIPILTGKTMDENIIKTIIKDNNSNLFNFIGEETKIQDGKIILSEQDYLETLIEIHNL